MSRTLLWLLAAASVGCSATPMKRIRISSDGRGFVREDGGEPFVPWGFNYDHDESGRLLEDYWEEEWEKVVEDFREMRALGANTVRVHLQLGRFMRAPDELEEAALERLERLLSVAEELELRLDITGLGCYRKSDVPPWYDAMGESERWSVQETFWAGIAARCASSPAVFCYDLMNEPVVPGGPRGDGDWLGPPFADKYHYVQFIALDPAGRERHAVAREWIRRLARAIREHDPHTPITVGLVPWSLDRPGLTSGFIPRKIAPELDFLSVHVYPEHSKIDEAIETLRGFSVGKPVLIEETFPLKCSPDEFERFLERSRPIASGWIGFYWGRTPEDCRRSGTIQDHLMLRWLELFEKEAPRRMPGSAKLR